MVLLKKTTLIIFILMLLFFNFGCKSSSANSDASLSNLIVLNCTLIPAFSPGILLYDAMFLAFPRSVRVIANTTETNATMTINGNPANSGSEVQVDVSPSTNNIIRIVVTASDGETTRTYVITVKEEPE